MDCLFCSIVKGEINSQKAYEDDKCVAFYDIAPQAPVHILVIPKEHIPSAGAVNESNSALIAHIFEKIPNIAKSVGISSYRIISNVGEDACQSVKHMHFHIIGGSKLSGRMA